MRIAHITDLHWRNHLPGSSQIPSRKSREMPVLFRKAVQNIAAQNPDLLVCSGDLLDYPFDAFEDPDTKALGLADLRQIAEILDPLDCAKVVIPGNHDQFELVREVFGHLPNDFACEDHRILVFQDREMADHVPERLGTERKRFESAIHDSNSLPQIHVQHYLVWPEKNEGYPHTYRDGPALRDALIHSRKVRLCLSGHYHAGIELFEEDGVHFATAPAFCEPPHTYRMYELDDQAIHAQSRAISRND